MAVAEAASFGIWLSNVWSAPMSLSRWSVVAGLLLVPSMAFAQQERIQPGKVTKVDKERMTVTLEADGKERTLLVTEQTRVFGAEGKPLAARLAAIPVGQDVQFRQGTREGQDILIGLRAGRGNDNVGDPPPVVDASKLKPLPELGAEQYQGFAGGLYSDGHNERPASHEAAGLALAKRVRPLNANGKPDAGGKIVLLSIGMSNTSQASMALVPLLRRDKTVASAVVFVNGAQGGMTARAIQDPLDNSTGSRYWSTIDERLEQAGVTRQQVQAVWIKQADAGPTSGFPAYAQTLQKELARIAQLVAERFPNCRLAYVSSRSYGGYAKTRLNPEPYAYESGFAVKWLIEQQLNGDKELNFNPQEGPVKAPWLSWGPYLWANGQTPNKNSGLMYEPTDFGNDGTHPSRAGQDKIGRELFQFLCTDSTTQPWFVRAD